MYQAYLGLDRSTGEVRLAVLHDDAARTTVEESTVLVEIVSWSRVDDRNLPTQLRMYRTLREGRKWYFDQRPGAELYLLDGGELAPEFEPQDFMP